jgi:hypothetical protein
MLVSERVGRSPRLLSMFEVLCTDVRGPLHKQIASMSDLDRTG